ncbi:nose resistant to fluoxetine protein 6-like [Spodoptera frugiperda]|uniref:Nose resistant to fluoxetine protein 6-like n=1 Tax=Spodoptera frugiperda TaxID=7108 RepID=A0A9R0CZR3_SPOFR|nr:nose resistant to fluoxetine protein 6-like [Spodoptera frugiperda]
MFPLFLVFFLFFGKSAGVIYSLNASEYYKMPALYGLDNYETCVVEPGWSYCMVDVDLHKGSNPELMRMIQEYSDHRMKHFNHTQIHRGVCVTHTCREFIRDSHANETSDLSEVLEACLNKSLYSQYGLEGRLANVHYCKKDGDKVIIDNGDIAMAVVYVVLIVLNAVGSLYDVCAYDKEDKTGNPYILAFSIRRNWRKLTAPSNSARDPRLERLKIFHGLRAMTMFCVLFSHTTLVMSFSYVDNPLYIETAYDDPLKQILFNGSLVTHTFFVMSSFLLAYNFQLYAEKHKPSWIQLPKGILLRWLRLTPTYALIMFSISTWMRHGYQGPLWGLVVSSEADACRQYWWAQLLYINNYVYDDAFCMPQTWYLASDTQLFCLGLLVCLVARKCKTRTILLSVWFVIALAIVAGQTYFQDLDAVVIQAPEAYRNLYATDATFRLLYARGHTNMSTYILGMAGGFLAYRWQNGKDMDKYKKYRFVVWLVFPLGLAVILSGGLFYSDGERAPVLLRVLYATLYKPLFQFLMVLLILACVFKIESTYRCLLEWRGWAWLGRVTYCAFLLHTLFQRGLIGAQLQLVHMSDYSVMILLAASIFLTYMCACGLWLCVEAPMGGIIKAALTPSRDDTDKEDTTKV